MIVNYPIRRRILMALMIFGNLGLVSVAATFIVAFVDAGRDAGAIVVQAFSIAAAIAIILVMTTLKSVDRVMCAFVGAVLMKATSLARRRYQRTLQLEDDYCIAEHVIKGLEPRQLAVAGNEENALQFLALRAGETRDFRTVGENTIANPGDIVICFGTEAAHDAFEATMNRSDNVGSVA